MCESTWQSSLWVIGHRGTRSRSEDAHAQFAFLFRLTLASHAAFSAPLSLTPSPTIRCGVPGATYRKSLVKAHLGRGPILRLLARRGATGGGVASTGSFEWAVIGAVWSSLADTRLGSLLSALDG